MQYPSRFDGLLGYPFPRLRALLQGIPAGGEVVKLSIGEPKHSYPKWLNAELERYESLYNSYPPNFGTPEWQQSVLGWIKRRYDLDFEEFNITPVNGTREGLYNSALALFVSEKSGQNTPAKVLLPNPFYQVYMMGAKTLGLEVEFVNCEAANNFLPDYASLPAETLDATTAVFLCSPSNPQGAIAPIGYLKSLVALAEKHDFLIFADEVYSEIYFHDAPPSVMQAAMETGIDPNRVVVFQSLSKRSNAPGLRSGFALSGRETMARIRELRAYAGAPVPGPVQMASAKLWDDEVHVRENRELYAAKVQDAEDLFGAGIAPEGGMFLWLPVGNSEDFTRRLWQETGIEVLPGNYLSAPTPMGNPGEGYVRIALVADREVTKDALVKIKNIMSNEQGAI